MSEKAFVQVRDLKTDDYIRFPDSISATVLDEIRRFWDTGERFARYGYLHRRGYLFYGKQGCGKSSLIGRIVSDIISDGHAAFFCQHPYYFVRCMEKFREVEPARPIVCIFEDIDAIIARIDILGLAEYVVEGIDLPGIIRSSTGSMASEGIREVRRQGISADERVAHLVDRLLRRPERAPGSVNHEPVAVMVVTSDDEQAADPADRSDEAGPAEGTSPPRSGDG